MPREILMATVTDRFGDTEAEPVIVDLYDDGRLTLLLDDGRRLELDFDELLAIASDESAAAAHAEAA